MTQHMIERAIHESGHAVAHERFDILQAFVTIVPDGDRQGACLAEGAGSVYSASEAADMVLAYCAGYAAMIAAGYAEEAARDGCGDDFAIADELIEFWALPGGRDAWLAKAVELMRRPENVTAVAVFTEHLLEHKTLDGDYLGVLIGLADGNVTQAEFDRYLRFRARDGTGYAFDVDAFRP